MEQGLQQEFLQWDAKLAPAGATTWAADRGGAKSQPQDPSPRYRELCMLLLQARGTGYNTEIPHLQNKWGRKGELAAHTAGRLTPPHPTPERPVKHLKQSCGQAHHPRTLRMWGSLHWRPLSCSEPAPRARIQLKVTARAAREAGNVT